MGGSEAAAFGLVCAAGLSTSIGAALVFSDRAIEATNQKVLAGSLGISAGVMLYVSFMDIFRKSLDSYMEVHDESDAYAYATMTFFGGFAFYAIMYKAVLLLDPEHNHDFPAELGRHRLASNEAVSASDVEAAISEDNAQVDDPATENETEEEKKKKLQRMGLMTALAIGIHNFPEGLATFVGYIADPSVGIALAIAISIHNIPEGLCVAVPVYYATNNRCKAFGWAMISGASELVGGGLGWAVLANSMNPDVYAALFGIVGGMMVMICISDLIPTAHRYDPEDSVTTKSILLGMVIMALSLVLLNL